MILQTIFGLTKGSLTVWLRFSKQIIAKVLHFALTNEDAIVRLPTAAKTALFVVSMIIQKFPLIKICWVAMDGLKIALQQTGIVTQQNNFYNG